jgi:hypothetical protein
MSHLKKEVRICLLSFFTESFVFQLISKKKTHTYRTAIFPVVLCGRESWSLRLLDEHGLRVFENRIWGRCLGLRRMSYEESGDDYITRSFKICTPYQIKSSRMSRAGHVARVGTGVVHTGFWWGNLMERDHLQDKGIDRKIILKWGFQK